MMYEYESWEYNLYRKFSFVISQTKENCWVGAVEKNVIWISAIQWKFISTFFVFWFFVFFLLFGELMNLHFSSYLEFIRNEYFMCNDRELDSMTFFLLFFMTWSFALKFMYASFPSLFYWFCGVDLWVRSRVNMLNILIDLRKIAQKLEIKIDNNNIEESNYVIYG